MLTGHDFYRTAFGHDTVNGRCNHEGMRQVWDNLRAGLLAEWIGKHPGTHPYAWWQFDAPERQQRVDGKGHPFDNDRRTAFIADGGPYHPLVDPYRLWKGKPAVLIPYDPPVHDDFVAQYETEFDHLDRLGLLVEGECVGRDPMSTTRKSAHRVSVTLVPAAR